jgi:glycine cleavage system H protein
MAAPQDLRYTKTHEWVRQDGETATIGISDYAQTELGDITYIELPEVGDAISRDQPFGVVESVKAASDVYAPVDGEVVDRNEEAIAAPELVNASPYDQAWLIKVRLTNPEQVGELLDAAAYDEVAATAAH